MTFDCKVPAQLEQLGSVLDVLLAPREPDVDQWCRQVIARLGPALGAERAVLIMWGKSAPSFHVHELDRAVVEEYCRDFRSLDLGMDRRDQLELSVWSRRMLWDEEVLARSAYFNEFARPHDLLDTVGLTFDVARRRISITLLYSHTLGDEELRATLLELGMLLPAFRLGLDLHLQPTPLECLPGMLDKVGESVALFSISGLELHRNRVLQRTLEQDPERARLVAEVDDMARIVCQTVRQPRQVVSAGRPPAAWRRLVRTSHAQYCVRGSVLYSPSLACDPAILVSMETRGRPLLSPDATGTRFGLTRRESEVASLLADRFTNVEVAEALGISSHTARHHTESVLLKLGVNSRKELRRLLGRIP